MVILQEPSTTEYEFSSVNLSLLFLTIQNILASLFRHLSVILFKRANGIIELSLYSTQILHTNSVSKYE